MNRKRYRQIRIIVALFVGIIISLAVTRQSYLLATAGVLTGMVFMALVRSKVNIKIDEREVDVQEKAAKMAYSIFTPTIGILSFLLLLPAKGNLVVFSRGEWMFIESLGFIFAYLTLFLIAIYAISYHFFNKKYGGDSYEE